MYAYNNDVFLITWGNNIMLYFCQQVRKNKFVEILPINVGCLGACTYCKTKHARGHLGSYTIDSLVSILRMCLLWGNAAVASNSSKSFDLQSIAGGSCENCCL